MTIFEIQVLKALQDITTRLDRLESKTKVLQPPPTTSAIDVAKLLQKIDAKIPKIPCTVHTNCSGRGEYCNGTDAGQEYTIW